MSLQYGRTGPVPLLLSMSIAGASWGQDRPDLITDRPDQTESSEVVGSGVVQLEMGWTLAQEEGGAVRVRSVAVPGVLARIGLGAGLEARLGFAGWMRSETRSAGAVSSSSDIGDLEVGGKYRFAAGNGVRPAVALLAAATLPTGREGFSSGRIDPTVRIAVASQPTERLSVGTNLGVVWTTQPVAGRTETLADLLYTFVVGAALTNRVSLYSESFGTLALESAGESRHAVDGGVTFLAHPSLQFDVSGGLGLSQAADDWFVGGGVSLRVPW